MVCGDCGSFLRGCPIRGGKGYICGKYKAYGKDTCHRNAIREEYVWKAVLDREALEGNDSPLQAPVIREIISKVEVHYRHERTHGKQSKDGQGTLLSVPNRLLLYVRLGLGITLVHFVLSKSGSRLCISACQ